MTSQHRSGSVGRVAMAAVLFIVLPGFLSIEALFAPSAEPWPVWTAHDESSKTRVDHAVWNRLLARYRSHGDDGIARFAYRGVTAEDRAALNGYILALSGVGVSGLNRAEQRAYWINLYNALTVKLILDHGVPQSIRDIDISPGLFADGPWGAKLVSVEGRELSLNDIEHRILRPIWRDPRIHYAVNCASLGCPDLMPVAFTAENTAALLERAARDYVNHPRGARLVDGLLHVSSIYVWFEDDFGGEDGVLRHLAKYARPELRRSIERLTAIADHSYDWALNGLPVSDRR